MNSESGRGKETGENVTSLESFRKAKVENSFSDYLKVLSFNDLMNESEHLIREMKSENESQDIFSKTKVMMNEFTSRLEKESKQFATAVRELTHGLDDKSKN